MKSHIHPRGIIPIFYSDIKVLISTVLFRDYNIQYKWIIYTEK